MSFNQILKKQERLMKEYGYFIHNVFAGEDDESGLDNHHTHGLKESFNHLDLQIVLPIHPQIANEILNGMVLGIKEGESFEDILISDRIIQGYTCQLIKVKEGDRYVIRVILPDENGLFPTDKGCADGYSNQLDDLDCFFN